jgi:energy-converting hydrogenase Eha subunit A
MSRQKLENNSSLSYYEGIYGKGGEPRMYFAFRIIPILLIALGAFIILSIIGFFIVGSDVLPVVGVLAPLISAPLTFMLGSVYGKPTDK